MAIFCQIAILALLSLCIHFKNSFGQMTSFWLLWKTYYTFLLKKCLWPRLGPSMYLSERIDWIISSFPQWISKIIFVLCSWDYFGSLGCRIGECPFLYVLILFLGSVVSSSLTYILNFWCPKMNRGEIYTGLRSRLKRNLRNQVWLDFNHKKFLAISPYPKFY